MKFGQLIEYNMKILFFKYHTKNEGVRLVCRTDFGFWKNFKWSKCDWIG